MLMSFPGSTLTFTSTWFCLRLSSGPSLPSILELRPSRHYFRNAREFELLSSLRPYLFFGHRTTLLLSSLHEPVAHVFCVQRRLFVSNDADGARRVPAPGPQSFRA